MTGYTWQVEKTENPRFPYRIAIREAEKTVLALRAQDKWPGQKGQIFCLRETGSPDDGENLELVETVPIAVLRRQGKRVEIVLDRANRKRCDFLFLRKTNKTGEPYEQIFFRTQTGLRAHRSKGSPLLYGSETVEVVIDSSERYPWRFPSAEITRTKLPAGDYALVWENRYIAVVERKTFDNLLHDLYEIRICHQKLTELSSFPNPALVVEAQYGDFSDPKRIGDRLSAPHLNRLIGEISALHPGLQIIFAGNRKLANAWTTRFFQAVRSRVADTGQSSVEAAERPPTFLATPVRIDLEIRKAVLENYGQRQEGCSMQELREAFPDADTPLIRRVVQQLKREDKIYSTGKSRGTRYFSKLEAP